MNIIREFLYNKSFEDWKWYKIANLKDSSTLSSSNRTKLSNVVKLHSTKSHVWARWGMAIPFCITCFKTEILITKSSAQNSLHATIKHRVRDIEHSLVQKFFLS